MVGDHRVGRSLELFVAFANLVPHPRIAPGLAQQLKLLMQVEDEGRDRGPSCVAGRPRVQADDEVRSAGSAEGEIPVGRISRHIHVPNVVVSLMELCQL